MFGAALKNWIVATILKLIRRVGEYDFDPNATFNGITMNDLPPLN
jgi:hypothetical protein